MPDQVEVVMTFDDGPHVSSGSNKTRNVLNLLHQRDIIGTFFILTHDRDPNSNAYCRGKHDPTGLQVVGEILEKDHLIGIHTSEDGQNTHDRTHPQRYSQGWLDEDLVQGKDFINEKAGYGHCKFVRGPYGYTNSNCNSVYTQQDLQFVHWDIDPRDYSGTVEQVQERLETQIVNKVNGGKSELVILFHDIQNTTGYNLADFIETIEAAITSCGKEPVLSLSKARTEEILTDQSSEN